jgi:hypothetical protein
MFCVAIHDSEKESLKNKSFPNYALMKISSYYKSKGDNVEWFMPIKKYDKVYSSKIFTFTKDNPYLPEHTIKGGSGYDVKSVLPTEIENQFPDYSIYPDCDYSIGFTTRGCINNCFFCVVPAKEGKIRAYKAWGLLLRPDTDKLVLMDNNILSCDFGIKQLEGIANFGGIKLDVNQGLDITLLDDGICKILSKIKWISYIRFSCDSVSQIKHFEKANALFQKHGISAHTIFIYTLVLPDVNDADSRIQELLKINKSFNIYAQPFYSQSVNKSITNEQKEFCRRYVYSGLYRCMNWAQYCNRTSGRRLSKTACVETLSLFGKKC